MSRDKLEQNIIELATQVESQKQKIQWLQEQFNLLQQKRFGASSEKDMTDGDQMSLFNEAEWTVDEADGQIPEPDMAKVAPPKKTKTKGGKLRMVSGLPKETIDFRLSKEEQIWPECGEKLTEVRKTIRRELIVIPAQVKVREYIDAVYACRNCQKNGIENPMHTGSSPKPLLENSLASASFVSDIMKKKFVDGVPIYRQEAELKRKGIRLTRQTMSNWVIRCRCFQSPVKLLPLIVSCGFTEAENGIRRAGSSCMSIRITEGKRILRISLETSRDICRRTDMPDTILSQSGRKILPSA